MTEPDTVLRHWLGEVGTANWYAVDPAIDDEIRRRFLPDWEAALAGERATWCADARGTLAFLILTDQYPRNMFRGDARSFATDALARGVAETAIARGLDMEIAEPERQFFYLPLMHSEDPVDQDHAVKLVESSLPETGGDSLPHARAHREIIRRFGRFPFRNAALGRETTEEEQEFLNAGGYGAVLRSLADKG